MNAASVKAGLTLLFVALGVSCPAQVYSVHVYAGGRTYEHQWHIGSSPNWFGFTQYREYQDAKGMVLLTSEQHRTVRRPAYTQIDLGQLNFRVKMPAWGVASVASIFIVCLTFLGLLGLCRRMQYVRVRTS
jgi:hypothetical protein